MATEAVQERVPEATPSGAPAAKASWRHYLHGLPAPPLPRAGAREREAAAAVAALVALPACGLFTFEDPSRPWQVTLTYRQDPAGAVAAPGEVLVDGPRSDILLINSTPTTRGFVIEDLAVYEEVDGNSSKRIGVEGLDNGERYAFYDDLHDGGPTGAVVVSFNGGEGR